MRLTATSLAAAVIMAGVPAYAARTWDVNWVNGVPTPQILDILPGDTVRWPNTDSAPHAIVQTAAGNRTCNNLAGGFNSGTKTTGQAYLQRFPTAGVINYKDGIGSNCQNGGMGTIYVGARPSNSTDPTGTPVTSTPSGTRTTSSTPGGTGPTSSTTMPTGTATTSPSAANGMQSTDHWLLMTVAGFVGAMFF
ncbi:hypothetical protein BGW38_010869 [Lunasporangiospora selenospora]|uniref:Plastocyanin n=1 Tax=Lunasporangiospora selenospora TaxID=979761 RepID=A0A9P6KFD6_9FUNG|nr:hypothetical protein BGW38_010869 [Lunasporangiospora selenospora]